MDIKELFEVITGNAVTPFDTKILMIGASESIQYLNAITNMESEEMTKFLFALYSQNPIFKEAIDALRGMIESEMRRTQPAGGTPVNTSYVDVNADKAIADAMNELGAIYVGSGNKSKC